MSEFRTSPMRVTLLLAMLGPIWAHSAHADGAVSTGLPAINKSISRTDAAALAALYSPSVADAAGGAQIAQGDADAAKSDLNPVISATTYATAGSASNIFGTSPGVSPQNLNLVPSQGFGDQNVALMIPLYNGGGLSGKRDEAGDAASEMRVQEDVARRTAERDAMIAYDDALRDAALVDAAQARVTAEDEQVQVVQQEVAAGRLAPLDLLHEQAEQADAEQALDTTSNQAQLSLVDLKVALGADLTSQITQSDSLDGLYAVPALVPDSLDAALRPALSQRPEIVAAQDSVASAEAAVRAARSFDAPQVYGVAMGDVSAQSQGGSSGGYSAGLTASLPLDDGGRKSAEVEGAKGRLAQAKAQESQVIQQVERDVIASWLDNQSSESAHASAVAGLAEASQAYDLAMMRYNVGKSTNADRLDALSSLTRSKANLATATAAVLDARVQMQWATGNRLGK